MPSAYDIYTFYLKAEDLSGPTAVTISGVRVEDVFNPRAKRNEKRLVVSFSNLKQALPLNKTQAAELIALAKTDDFTRWPGAQIIIAPGTADNGKRTVAIAPARPTKQAHPADDPQAHAPIDADVEQSPPKPKPAQSNATGNEGADEMAGLTLLQRYGALYAQAAELGIEAEYVEPPIGKAKLVEMGKALKAKIDEATQGPAF